MTTFDDILKMLTTRSVDSANKENEVPYIKLLEFEKLIQSEPSGKIWIEKDVFITPFYIDNGIYELYSYDLDILLTDGKESICQANVDRVSTWLVKLRNSLTQYKTTKEFPFVPIDVLEKYLEFLKTSYLVKSDIVKVFRCKPEIEKMHLAIYL